MTQLVLTADQQAGYDAFCQFVLDPQETVFVLRGFSGTGKSTLVSHCIDQYPNLMKTLRLINPTQKHEYELKLTATTNKACEALHHATGHAVTTIQSTLGLRVRTDYKTGKTDLILRNDAEPVEDLILVIDEASFIDSKLLRYVFSQTRRCKIVLVGDPAQLLTVGCNKSPVFDAGFPEARLNEVVRQAKGNPIIDLSTKFRETVESGEWFAFQPDGHFIQHLPREDFEEAIKAEFLRPDRHHSDSRVLAWTNKTVIAYNKAIANLTSGDPEFKEGDYAVCNSFISAGRFSIKTDQMVQITDIGGPETQFGAQGRRYEIDHRYTFFMPDSLALRKQALREARAADNHKAMQIIQDQWIDLREAFACTINKSQGSTYGKVFIDLDDLKRCPNGNQLARMLYVGVSRASQQVFLTGDLA